MSASNTDLCMFIVALARTKLSNMYGGVRRVLSEQAEALKVERATTESFLEPLKAQLRDLDDQLKESSMKIDGVKAGISANDKKINSLLKIMVNS